MITVQSIRYLFLYGIVCWLMGPVLDMMGIVGENKYTMLTGVSSILFTLILAIITFVSWVVSDRSDVRDMYRAIFGRKYYHWIFTMPLIPAAIYGFVYDYVPYTIICIITFLIVERWRTVQNQFADEYMKIDVAESLRKSKVQTVDLS